jgi:hypothetical protein
VLRKRVHGGSSAATFVMLGEGRGDGSAQWQRASNSVSVKATARPVLCQLCALRCSAFRIGGEARERFKRKFRSDRCTGREGRSIPRRA